MDLKSVKDLVKLAKKEGVAKIVYEENDKKIAVTLPSAHAAVSVQAPSQVVAPPVTSASSNSPKPVPSNLHEIKSPFVGTFYSSPSPGDPEYVKVGDKVAPGKVLCILEAMKIMNEIECDISGEVVEICKENESLVEYGEVLYRVKKS
jgi:acetyl-CoA carboxylase biotin carboxyl carrier protein